MKNSRAVTDALLKRALRRNGKSHSLGQKMGTADKNLGDIDTRVLSKARTMMAATRRGGIPQPPRVAPITHLRY